MLAVIVRIVTNPVTNVFQKQLAQRSAEPLVIIMATHGLLTAFALPLLAGRSLGALGVDFWANMLTAVVLAVAGYVLLWYALRSTDLSLLAPINAYKAVLGLLLAVVLIGEVPTLFGLLGVALIVAGSYFVIDRVPGQPHSSAFRLFTREPGVQLRFAALICSAIEAIFLKRALLLSSPISRHWKGIVKKGCAGAYVAHLERETFPSLRRLPGFVDASILRRETDEGTEFQIVTVWRSLDAIQAFAGHDLSAAVVPDAAQTLMATYDRFVIHYEIVGMNSLDQ